MSPRSTSFLRLVTLGLSLMSAALATPAGAAESTQTFALMGDAGIWNQNTIDMHASMKRAGVKQLVMPGDNLYWGAGSYEEQWGHWAGFDFSVVAIGNHKVSYPKEVEFFKMPGEYYSKVFPGDIRFIVLNSDNEETAETQAQWLEQQLQQRSAMTFLVWHHSPYTLSSAHNWREKAAFQTRMRDIVRRHKDQITALLLGHDHIGAFYCADSVPLIVTGASWETREPETMNYIAEDKTKVSARWVYPRQTAHWGRLEINPAQKLAKLSFIRASDDASLYSLTLGEDPKSNPCLTP